MPDSPDFQKYLPNSVRFSLQDMSELAARLGSISVYDRRGEIIWYDDFRNGIGGWTAILNGAGADAVVSVTGTFRSPFNALLKAGTTTSKNATLRSILGTIELQRGGLEACFGVSPTFDLVSFLVVYYKQRNRWSMEVQLDKTNNIIKLYNSAGTYTTIATLSNVLQLSDGNNFIKLVWDTSKNSYIRLLINSFSFDISSILTNKSTTSTQANMIIDCKVQGTGSAGQLMYLNHVILTSNEP